jgi:hypothetical protein
MNRSISGNCYAKPVSPQNDYGWAPAVDGGDAGTIGSVAGMKNSPARKIVLSAVGGVCAASLGVPSLGFAATPLITGDAGTPIPVTPGLVVRNMDVDLSVGLTAPEGLVTATVVGPDGVAAATAQTCTTPSSARAVDYRGNGVYTVSIQSFAAGDFRCATSLGPVVTSQYTVTAGIGLGPSPFTSALTREPNGFSTGELPLPITLNPGALSTEVRYARNVTIGPDGAIVGPAKDGFVLSSSPTVGGLRLDQPGEWFIVARAKGFTSATGVQFFSPWSAPVRIPAFAPFDFETSTFTDSTGPTYGYRVKIREPSAKGRVAVAIASGSRKGTFRNLGKFTISSKGFVKTTFRQRGAGIYRLRFRFAGSSTVAPGEVTQRVRITRRIVFR